MSNKECQGVVFGCMDWRFGPEGTDALHNLMETENVDSYDILTLPGGAGKRGDLVDQWTDLSIKLHNPTHIILTAHEDCGAGAKREDLKSALDRVSAEHTDREVQAFWLNLDGSWKEISLNRCDIIKSRFGPIRGLRPPKIHAED